MSSKFLCLIYTKNKNIDMKKKKFTLTRDQWLLFAILFILALTSCAFEYWGANMNIYSILILKGIGLIFDGLIAVYYRRFRRRIVLIAKRHSLSYYSRETAPFLLVFGGAYALKIGIIAILSIFFPSLALSIQSVKIAIFGMVGSTLAFAWLFRKLTKWVYKKTRKLDQEAQRRKQEHLEKKAKKL